MAKRAKLNEYEVTVHEHVDRLLTKTFKAKSLADARSEAESDEWTTKNGWGTPDPDEGFYEIGITKIENVNDEDDSEEE